MKSRHAASTNEDAALDYSAANLAGPRNHDTVGLMSVNPSIKAVRKISEIPQAQWDALLANGSPFLKSHWLDSLEESGCVNDETGWLPHHLVVERAGKVVG